MTTINLNRIAMNHRTANYVFFFGTEIPSLEFMKGEKQLKAILPHSLAEGVHTRRPGETTSALVLNRIYAF